jgi:hypothetical protein
MAAMERASVAYVADDVPVSGPSSATALLSTNPFAIVGAPASTASTSFTRSAWPSHLNSTTSSPLLVRLGTPFEAIAVIVPLAIEYVGATPFVVVKFAVVSSATVITAPGAIEAPAGNFTMKSAVSSVGAPAGTRK